MQPLWKKVRFIETESRKVGKQRIGSSLIGMVSVLQDEKVLETC